jgi:hypothetical protein
LTLRKRKLQTVNGLSRDEEDEVAAAAANAALAGIGLPRKKTPKKLKEGDTPDEKRLKPFRKHAPKTYLERLDRVRFQRMFLIDRERKTSADGRHEEEVFDLAGTTGNIYQVTISRQPRCTCPDNLKGNQCKHIVYVGSFAPLQYACAVR